MTRTPDIGIIFDCDGTLLDSMGVWHSLDDRLAERAGVVFTEEDKDYLTASTIPECARYMHERYAMGAHAQEVIDIIHEEMYRFYVTEAVPKPGVMDFVEAMHAEGIPMAVASSTPPRLLRAGLEFAGLSDYMEAIVSVEDVGVSKRKPVVYDRARASLGTERGRTWGFEDALYAIRTLNEAGYHSFGIYDSDIAGTPEELEAAADRFAVSFEDIDPVQFMHLITS